MIEFETKLGCLKVDNERIAKELIKLAKEIEAVENTEVDYYFQKFQDKMGRRTSIYTAFDWIEGINLSEGDEMLLKKKIVDYLGVVGCYKVHKNGLLISSPYFKSVVNKILRKISDKLHYTDVPDYRYLGKRNSEFQWGWYGLFRATAVVMKELEKNGFRRCS